MALIGTDNLVETADLTASAALSGSGPELLRVPIGDPTVAWQTPAGVTSASLRLGFLATSSLRAVLLSRTNLSTAATLRVRVGARDAFFEASPLLALAPGSAAWSVPAGLSVTRTHTPTGASATRLRADGVWEEVAANVLRLHHDASGARLGWLREPGRTNGLPNPRCEGAVAGTSGTAPTGWTISSSASGLTRQIVGVGTQDGIPYVEFRYTGTAGSAGAVQVTPVQPASAPAAATGQQWVSSLFLALVGGTLPSTTNILLIERDGGGGIVTTGTVSVTPPGAALVRREALRTLSGGATVAGITTRFDVTIPNGTVVDFTLRVGAPQLEQGAFATTPILPPVGAPAAATRGVENATMALGTPLSAGALYVEQVVLAHATSGQQGYVRVSDGTSNNRAEVRTVGSSPGNPYFSSIAVVAETVVSATIGNSGQAVALGTLLRTAIDFEPDRFTLAQGGAFLGTDTAGASPTVNTLQVQSGEAISLLRDVRVYGPLSDPQLLALTTSGSTLTAAAYDSGVVGAGVAAGVGQALHILPVGISGEAALVEISDPANPDGFLNIPLAYVGAAISVSISSAAEVDRDVRRADVTTRGGSVFVDALSAARMWRFELPTPLDTLTPAIERLISAGAAGRNILFVPREAHARAATEAVFGLLSPGPLSFATPSGSRRKWTATIMERL
jgi:hypothetical protein